MPTSESWDGATDKAILTLEELMKSSHSEAIRLEAARITLSYAVRDDRPQA